MYATSWRRTGTYFPLAWNPDSHDVPGLKVSYRYAALAPSATAAFKLVHVRLRENAAGPRLVARVELRSADDALLAADQSRPETADLNDMPEFKLPDEAVSVALRVVRGPDAREKIIPCAACARAQTFDLNWDQLTPVSTNLLTAEAWLTRPIAERGTAPDLSLTRAEAQQLTALAWSQLRSAATNAAAAELAAKKVTIGDYSMKWLEKTFGDAPFGQRSLWITLHGGGQATTEENDLNWKGYYGRYEFPPGSINVAPRAPVDAWNMWFVQPVDGLLDRIIADMVTTRGVDPNQVYLIGYSAGGDGVYQLAPRLADRFAAATMCAGHPNASTPEGLRNLPFFLYMGGDDTAYNRNTVVRQYSAKIDVLQAADPAGYVHRCTVYPGLQHNMQGREAETIPRMLACRRATWPTRVVWKQDSDVTHSRFYWLASPADAIHPNEIIAAHVTGQTITLETPATGHVILRLSDDLLDLDQPIQVMAGPRLIFSGKVPRTITAITTSLIERADPDTIASALLPVGW